MDLSVVLACWCQRLAIRIVVVQKRVNGYGGDPMTIGKSSKKEFPVVLGLMRTVNNARYVVLVPARRRDSMPFIVWKMTSLSAVSIVCVVVIPGMRFRLLFLVVLLGQIGWRLDFLGCTSIETRASFAAR